MIRPFRSEDARAVAEIQVRGWRWAYADFIAEEDMPDLADREERWRSRLPWGRAYVWDQEGLVVGVSGFGPARDEELGAEVAEVYVLYVDPPAQGAGVGGALLAHAETTLADEGFAEAVVWTFEPDGHAREFYERRGWRRDGARQPMLGTHGIRYRKPL